MTTENIQQPIYRPSRYTLTSEELNSAVDNNFCNFLPSPYQYISCHKPITKHSQAPAMGNKSMKVLYHPFRSLMLSGGNEIVVLHSYEDGKWVPQTHYQEPIFSPFDDESVKVVPEFRDFAWLNDTTFIAAFSSSEIRIISISSLSVIRTIELPQNVTVEQITVPNFHSKVFFCLLSNNRIEGYNWETGSLVFTQQASFNFKAVSISSYFSSSRLCIYFTIASDLEHLFIYKIPLIDFEFLEVEKHILTQDFQPLELERLQNVIYSYDHFFNSKVSFINDFLLLVESQIGVFAFRFHDSLLSYDQVAPIPVNSSASICWLLKSNFIEITEDDRRVLYWYSDEEIDTTYHNKRLSTTSKGDIIAIGLPTGQVLLYSVSGVVESLALNIPIKVKWMIEHPSRYYKCLDDGYISSISISYNSNNIAVTTEHCLLLVWHSI